MSAIVKEMPSRHLPFSTPTPDRIAPIPHRSAPAPGRFDRGNGAPDPDRDHDAKVLVTGHRARPRLRPGGGITPVSAVIITHNESRNIRRTLSRLYWCDEIVILDSYSTDETVEICREFGCRIFFRAFDGYGTQKRHAVALAKNDWILCIDADEVLSEELIGEILGEMKEHPRCDAYSLPMNLVFLGREFRYGKESQRYFLRLFNRNTGNFNADTLHEKIEIAGKVGKMNHHILHYSYHSLQQWLEKCNRYTTMGAEGAAKRGRRKSLLTIIVCLPFHFTRYFFLERNILNGAQGFYWSVLCTISHFVKYVKTRELDLKPGE
jgi:glycosyltransferase involved in cell wall biosynthesis